MPHPRFVFSLGTLTAPTARNWFLKQLSLPVLFRISYFLLSKLLSLLVIILYIELFLVKNCCVVLSLI